MMTACDRGIRSEPAAPCKSRNRTICPSGLRCCAAEHRGNREACHGYQCHASTAHTCDEETGEGRTDGGHHYVRREHPADLILRGTHAALHMRQRHVGDGSIQRLALVQTVAKIKYHRQHHRAWRQPELCARRFQSSAGSSGDGSKGGDATGATRRPNRALGARIIMTNSNNLNLRHPHTTI